MNTDPQPDASLDPGAHRPSAHPDPDQLSAFLEGALPEPERLATLRHMARCARCRELAFLTEAADPAYPGSAAALNKAAAPALSPRRELFGFFAPPGLLWTAALACCLLGVFLFQLRTRPHPAAHSTVAALHPTQPVQPSRVPAAASVPAPASPEPKPRTPATVPPATRLHRQPTPAGTVLASRSVRAVPPPALSDTLDTPFAASLPRVAAPPAPLPSSTRQFHGEARGASAVHSLSQPAPGTPAAAPAAAGPTSGTPLPQRVIVQPARQVPSSLSPPASANTTVNIATDQVSVTSAAEASSTVQLQAQPQTQPQTQPYPLPSHLPTATSVALGRHLLALDTAGTLFSSHRGGKHWKRVKPQWPDAIRSLELTPGDRFQLTTTAGALWTSTDGSHWSPGRP